MNCTISLRAEITGASTFTPAYLAACDALDLSAALVRTAQEIHAPIQLAREGAHALTRDKPSLDKLRSLRHAAVQAAEAADQAVGMAKVAQRQAHRTLDAVLAALDDTLQTQP